MIRIEHGDNRAILPTLDADSIDACVTDPPYALTSIVKRFANSPRSESTENTENPYGRTGRGFMGKTWDTGEVAFDPAFWSEVYRVLKPGAHLLAFGGTRGHHRMFCAIEDAGFEIRDCLSWLYGSGFPKSHNLGGKVDGYDGWGTALKPAWEPICLARKPLIGTVAANVLAHGTGAINVDACRIGETGARNNGRKVDSDIYGKLGPMAPVDYNKGRWPANVVHDGSAEVVESFPEAPGQQRAVGPEHGAKKSVNTYGDFGPRGNVTPRLDNGTAARFFYSAKADAEDRCGSKHPTVKPIDLMAYLCRLVTPPGGTVLDPFAGSGSTGMACLREGFDAILIEREAEYVADIQQRLDHVAGADTPLFSVLG